MVMGVGRYSLLQFWKFTIPMYFIRLLALTAGALLLFRCDEPDVTNPM